LAKRKESIREAKGGMETNLFKANNNNQREKRLEMGEKAVISAHCG
jgi:hypothetical protein